MENDIVYDIDDKKVKKFASMKRRRFFGTIWANVAIAVLAIIWVLPIIYIIFRSFDANTGLEVSHIIPQEWTLDNYKALFTDPDRPYGRWLLNTLFLAVLNCILTTTFTLVTAFALSRFRFKSRKPLMNISLILGMFPGFMSMTAVYIILDMLSAMVGYYLTGEIYALLLIWVCGAGMGFFVSKGYFDTIPNAIEEAALVEGANMFTVFFKIFLPMAKPIIIYTALTAFMTPWSDFVLSSVILRGNVPVENYTIAFGLYQMLSNPATVNEYFTIFVAGCLIEAVPVVILYIALQKFMVAGISAGAVKG